MAATILNTFLGLGASAWAILFSAIMAGVYAFFSSMWNRKTVRDRETIVLLNQTSWDKDYIQARNTFAKHRDNANGLTKCCEDPNSEEYIAIVQFLNYYELIAIGIGHGILSASVYQSFFRTRYVKDWQKSKAFIASIRINSKNELIFIKYEELAKKWEKKHNITSDE